MKTTLCKTLFATAILALPFGGAALAGQTVSPGIQTAQSGGGGIPAECAEISDPEQRAACIREKRG